MLKRAVCLQCVHKRQINTFKFLSCFLFSHEVFIPAIPLILDD